MNSKQKRKLKREEQRTNNSIDGQIMYIGRGLERMMFDNMRNLSDNLEVPQRKIFCGYIRQPIFYDVNTQEIIGGCVLQERVCRYNVPKENCVYDDCSVYKNEMKKTR